MDTASWLDGLSASALDERTLEIRLDEPRNDFLYLLAQPPLFAWPRHVYERDGRDWHRAVPLVGNGPFVLTGRDDDRVVLEAAPSWHGARGNVGEVTIELEASRAVAADRWRSGDYDVLDDVLARSAVADDETVVQRSPGMWTWYLGFDARRAPFDDARVRRALAHAIDRHGPAELLARSRGRHGRAAPADDAGALQSRRPGIRPGSCPRAPERSGLRRRTCPRRDRARVSRPVGRTPRPTSPPSSRGSAFEFDFSPRPPFPTGGRDRTARRPRLALGLGRRPPRPGWRLPRAVLRWPPWLYRDEQLERLLARAASLRDQDERLRIYREFERIWIGEQAAVVPIAYGDRRCGGARGSTECG